MVTKPNAREDILQAAAEMMSTQGAGGLRVAAVAAAAALNKRMIYHYFGDRQGLLAAVYRRQRALLLASSVFRPASKRVLRVLLTAALGDLSAVLPSDGDAADTASRQRVDEQSEQRAAKILLPYLIHSQMGPSTGAFSADDWRVFSEDMLSLAVPGWLKSERLLTKKKPVYRLPSASRPKT